MSYWGRGLIGLAMVAAGIAGSCAGLYALLLTGTCASGGPYVIAGPCPDGTGLRVLMLVGGIFLLLIGLVVFGLRRYEGERASIGIAAWCLGFGSLALTFLFAGFGPDAPPDDPGWRIFCALMGGFFALFVIAPLTLGRVVRGRRERGERLMRDGRRAAAVVTSVQDTGVTVDDDPRVKLTLEVRPPGETAFTAEKAMVVSRVAIPRVGDRATVWYDPADREEIALSLDAPGPGGEPGAPDEAAAVPREPDIAADLQQLGDLRLRGLLSDEEFAKAKDRLLGGS